MGVAVGVALAVPVGDDDVVLVELREMVSEGVDDGVEVGDSRLYCTGFMSTPPLIPVHRPSPQSVATFWPGTNGQGPSGSHLR